MSNVSTPQLAELIVKVVAWADARGFKEGATLVSQQVKGEEEQGEFAANLVRLAEGEAVTVLDDLGDQTVVGIIQAHMSGLDPVQLMESVYLRDPDDDAGLTFCRLVAAHGALAAAVGRKRDIKQPLINFFSLLFTMCTAMEVSPELALETAYDEIKDRGGKWIDGTFVKEADLG
ncbi:hypothetical protein [Vibrio phage vB_VpaS_AL-2]|nr:hypothetical protein [Vibrio phage vB_VpS_BA3]UFK26933.1 hypothetical protein [Vibrio phage vB_VpaS_AL-2]